MPQRARDRSALNTSHELLHYRDDRALQIAKQALEHPRDRRKSHSSPYAHCKCGYCDAHDRAPLAEFRLSRGGQPLRVGADDLRVHGPDGGRDNSGEEREKRHPGSQIDLWEIARPGRVRRDLPKGFEVIPRLREVVALEDSDEESEWEHDFELVDLPKTKPKPKMAGKEKGRGKSFAQAVKGKRRER